MRLRRSRRPVPSGTSSAPVKGRPMVRCPKTSYEALEQAIAHIDQDLQKEGPIEGLYDLYCRKLIENIKHGTGHILGTDDASLRLTEQYFRQVVIKDGDTNTKILFSFMLASFLGFILVEEYYASWVPHPQNRNNGLIAFPTGERFDVFGFTEEFVMQGGPWSLFEEFTEIRKSAWQQGPGIAIGPVRSKNRGLISRLGLRVSASLPERSNPVVRPAREIANRIIAFKTVLMYVLAPPEVISTTAIQTAVRNFQMGSWFTSEEKELLTTPRQQAATEQIDSIGWLLESLLALCWCLNQNVPLSATITPLDAEDSRSIYGNWTPFLNENLPNWFAQVRVRGVEEIAAMEDLYFCLHNAARNVALSNEPPPTGFLPGSHDLVIQHRRQALTWVLSPGVSWDKTDLSS